MMIRCSSVFCVKEFWFLGRSVYGLLVDEGIEKEKEDDWLRMYTIMNFHFFLRSLTLVLWKPGHTFRGKEIALSVEEIEINRE